MAHPERPRPKDPVLTELGLGLRRLLAPIIAEPVPPAIADLVERIDESEAKPVPAPPTTNP
jgi:hypothetical protein